jgi:ribosomal protein S18 acetylase RimI-like enzyme
MKPFILKNIKIEKASLNYSDEILKLLNSSHNLVGYRDEKFTLNEVKDYIRGKSNLVLISKLKGEIVGVIIANLWRDYCYLYLFIVDKPYRRKGIGNKMMEYLEKKVKKEGYIGLLTKKEDKEMINLIKKRGYAKGDKFIYFHKNIK